MNKDLSLFKSSLSDNTKPPTISTATTELAADNTVNKNYFVKAMVETSQHS
jgi:hypothetical protein